MVLCGEQSFIASGRHNGQHVQRVTAIFGSAVGHEASLKDAWTGLGYLGFKLDPKIDSSYFRMEFVDQAFNL